MVSNLSINLKIVLGPVFQKDKSDKKKIPETCFLYCLTSPYTGCGITPSPNNIPEKNFPTINYHVLWSDKKIRFYSMILY